MGQPEIARPKYTVSEYLDLEEKSDVRHAFYDGEIFAMAGTAMNHNRIVGRIRRVLENIFLPKGYDVFAENVKVEVIRNFYYSYPDLVVTCEPEDISGTYIVRQPSILVEVLSKSSATYDRDFKLRRYKEIASLQYYMLVSQYDCYVERYTKTGQEGLWTYQSFDSPDNLISFELLGFALSVEKIYEGIVFEAIDLNLPPGDFDQEA